MNRKLNLILGVSGHLPSGTNEAGFDAFYNNGIKPLVSALNKFPRINIVFNYSGVILNWIERRHPEIFMLLEDLISRKQAEFLGGGFYNPMLPLLPMADKIGQVEMLTTYLRKHFGKKPLGCWLPPMTWEQCLVGALNSCGMNFTFLEAEQFIWAGIKPSGGGFFSPCITEDQGKIITVFPLASDLGEGLCKGKPKEILSELQKKFPEGLEYPVLAIPLGKDTQLPPNMSYEKFFEELSEADSCIEFTTSGKVFKNLRYLNKVHFPGAGAPANGSIPSYCHPRKFLAANPVASGIYAKMIHVHTLINNQLRGDKTRKRTALGELWKSQDSGIFRHENSSFGLGNSAIRKAAYSSLLEAEKITREKKKFNPSLSVFDFDLDGEAEYIFQDEKLNCYIKTRGGGIFELDYLPSAWNYLDTLAPPGEKSVKGERRCAFVDWLAPPGTIPGDAGPDGIVGGRFLGNEEYEASEADRVRRRITFTLPPKAGFLFGDIGIEKTWQLKKNSLGVEYAVKNTGIKKENFVLCVEIDFSFPGEGEGFLKILAMREDAKESITYNKSAEIKDIGALEFQDIKNEALLILESSKTFNGRIFQVNAGLKNKEEYQSTCLAAMFPISLEGGKNWKAAFTLRINS